MRYRTEPRNSTAAQDPEFLRNTRIEVVEFDSEKRWSLTRMENKCFGIGLCIAVDKTYSNLYEHVLSLYISSNGRNFPLSGS
jgi:hypothetical protein